MGSYHRGGLALVALVAAFGLVACQGKSSEQTKEEAKETAEKVGEEAKQLGQKVGEEAKQVGEKVGEKASELTAKVSEDAKHGNIAAAKQTLEVKAALIAHQGIDASGIDVDTDPVAKTVTLKGTVPTAAQKTTAEHVAREKAEGYRVKNQLTVIPKKS